MSSCEAERGLSCSLCPAWGGSPRDQDTDSGQGLMAYSCRPCISLHTPRYLRLGEAQLGGQVSPLGQGQVLGLLEALVQRLELQARVNGPRLADLLALAVQPDLPVLDHRGGLLVLCGGTDENTTVTPGPGVSKPWEVNAEWSRRSRLYGADVRGYLSDRSSQGGRTRSQRQ